MGLLTMLDVALGLTFVYLLFALVASATNEAIAALLSSRAKWLRRGIESLFQGEPLKEIEKNVNNVLSHPATAHLSRRPGKRPGMGKLQRKWEVSNLPSDALLHALVSTHQEATYPTSVSQLRERIMALPDATPIRVALERLLNVDVDQTIEQFAERFDEWYQTFQQQISNWYRQKTHFMLWIISIVIAFAFNLDSILMVRALSVDETLRAELVRSANEAIESKAEDGALQSDSSVQPDTAVSLAPDSTANSAIAPQSDLIKKEQAGATATNDPVIDLKDQVARIQTQVLTLQAVGLPIGWTGTTADWRLIPTEATDASIGAIDWLFKLLGILLTAAAMTLGAPFWFDFLKKVSSVRSTGTKLMNKSASAESEKTHVSVLDR